jgi:hypothetical protein
MRRRAQCQCGALTVETDAEPSAVVVCSCGACQRKSGSVFGAGAYFAKDELRSRGESREYVRVADSGSPFHEFFCPACGSTVHWYSDRDPERIGVAVGAFADPHFPAPSRSVFDEMKHDWVVFGDDIPGFTRGRDSERSR